MLAFVGLISLFVVFLVMMTTKHHGFAWWKSKEGKRVAFGLFLAPLVAVLIGMLGGCSTVDVYAGLEHTKNVSPMCDSGGADDRLTSNLGIEGCRTVSKDDGTRLCGVYRHHSCAISQDAKSYDAFGLSVNRRIWGVR